jgi:hypothetical protein
MHVDEQQILSISRDLWATQLGLNIARANAVGPSGGDRTLTSCVRISGPWHGTVVVECPESVARHAAAMLYAADGAEASEDDVNDALGDLAEMIATRIRALLPENSKLSKPAIVSGDETLAGLRRVHDLHLSCEGRPVRIALLESEDVPASAA